MSRGNRQFFSISGFSARLTEACGSSRAVDIQRLLNISYQAAKNYINGRIPEPHILVQIARKTGVSIHWLLTGEGEKQVAASRLYQDTPVLSREMEASVRRICVEVINEKLEGKPEPRPKIVVLQSDEMLSEKVQEEPVPSPENSPK